MKTYRSKALILFLLMSLFVGTTAQAAGGINGNEAALLSAAHSTYQYNGKSYKVKSSYINQAYAYFSRDGVDISARQKASILSKAMGMVSTGIQKGYLEEIPESQSQSETKSETQTDTTKATPEPSNQSGTDEKYKEATSLIQIADDKNKGIKKQDLLKEAANIANQLNLGVKVDTATKKIAVTDKVGKVIFDNEKIIKDTGYSLFSTAIVFGAVILAFAISMIMIFKNKLFTYGEDKE